ncbi:MAG: hypothetical protein HOM55_09330 [Proteobacteria bacterium]|jgi:TRAP-type mannitol/chloroaromatic compound transport system permease small subunit|nr:hypothetical protein [Pseudomonadota bacterium]
MVALIFISFLAVVFYWQLRNVKSGKTSKKKAIGLYAGYTITLIILYGSVFMALVGIEELTHTAIIGEGYARTLATVIVGVTFPPS